jgi:hypothetical protein
VIPANILFIENTDLTKRQLSWLFWLLSGAFFCVCLVVAYGFGPLFTSDGKRDLAFAEALINVNFNALKYVEATNSLLADFDMRAPVLPYIVYIYLLAICKSLAGGYWLHLLVFINAIFYGVSGALLLSVIQNNSRFVISTLAAFSLMVLGFDVLQWIAMSQSTPIFLVIVVVVFRLVLAAGTNISKPVSKKVWLAAILLVIFATFVRPSTPPLIAFVFFGWIANVFVQNSRIGHETLRYRKIILSVVVLICMGIVLHAILMNDPSVFSEGFVRQSIEYFRESQSLGWIVWARPETYITPPSTVQDYIQVTLTRGAYFFWFLAQDFSFSHKVLNTIFFVPLYCFTAIGIFSFLFDKSVSKMVKMVSFLSVLLIILYAAFVAVTYLDYDWRYRTPTLPALLILASMGFDYVLGKIKTSRSSVDSE